MPDAPKVTFFPSAAKLRAWLAKHHATRDELWVGFRRVGSGLPTLTWAESVDEALRYGWIDGLRRSLGEEGYAIRFTPRRPGSAWSRRNVGRVATLEKAGRMTAAGRAAFAARPPEAEPAYSYERKDPAALPPALAKRLQADRAASAGWSRRPPSYRKAVVGWILQAKKEETRERRFATLLRCEAAGEVVPPMAAGKRMKATRPAAGSTQRKRSNRPPRK